MKKISLSLSALALIFSMQQSFAANSISANANARVVTALSVSETTALEFGSFAASGTSGTITQAGAVTGGVTAVSGGATRAAAVFAVTGENTATMPYTFTLPASATLNGPSAATMVADLSFASGTASRTLTTGSETVTVNGSLAVAANQTSGAYTGTYTVSVAY